MSDPILQRVHGFCHHYIRDMVYATNDGIITTFAVVAGVQGAKLSPFVVLALGFSNLAADGLSMAVGDYLGIKSERAAQLKDDFDEWKETVHAARHGLVTWLAFIIAGLLPLLPFVLGVPRLAAFDQSILLTAVAMFTVGALRTAVTRRRWWRSGLEMLLVGALAGGAAYFAGWAISAFISDAGL